MTQPTTARGVGRAARRRSANRPQGAPTKAAPAATRTARGARGVSASEAQVQPKASDSLPDVDELAAYGADIDDLLASGMDDFIPVPDVGDAPAQNAEAEVEAEEEQPQAENVQARVAADEAAVASADNDRDTQRSVRENRERVAQTQQSESESTDSQQNEDTNTEKSEESDGAKAKGDENFNPMHGTRWKNHFAETMSKKDKKALQRLSEDIENQRKKYEKDQKDPQNNIFAAAGDNAARLKRIHAQHRSYKYAMVRSVVRPLEQNVDFNAVANVATTATVMLLMSPQFRDGVSNSIRNRANDFTKAMRGSMSLAGKSKNFFSSVAQRARGVKEWHRKVSCFDKKLEASKTLTDRVPMDVMDAADTVLGVQDQAYTAMRAGVGDPKKISADAKGLIKDLYSEFESDGTDTRQVNRMVYTKIAERCKQDPAYASTFNQMAFGAVRSSGEKSASFKEISSGKFVDLNKYTFDVREPAELRDHARNIGSTFASDMLRASTTSGDAYETYVGYFAALEDPAVLVGGDKYAESGPHDVRHDAQRRARGFYQSLIDDGYSQESATQAMSAGYRSALEHLQEKFPQVMAEVYEKGVDEVQQDVTKFNEKLNTQWPHSFPASKDIQALRQHVKTRGETVRSVQQHNAQQKAQRQQVQREGGEQTAEAQGSHVVARSQRAGATRSLGDTMRSSGATANEARRVRNSILTQGEAMVDKADERSVSAENKDRVREVAETQRDVTTQPRGERSIKDAEKTKSVREQVQVPPVTQTPAQRNQAESYNSDYSRSANTGNLDGLEIEVDYNDTTTHEEEPRGTHGKKQSASAARNRSMQRIRSQREMITQEERGEENKGDEVEIEM